MNNCRNYEVRVGSKDIWNAFMLRNTEFDEKTDIPICKTNNIEIPTGLIAYDDAKHYYKEIVKKDPNFKENVYVHFYIDDQKFDGKESGVWQNPYSALEIISHFAGAITPDYSTFADFPDPIKRYNTYRMRAFGAWLSNNGVNVINNVRWGTEETWEYCFSGIPKNSIVAIGTVGSGLHILENRPLFETGINLLKKTVCPSIIIVYGSSNYKAFDEIRNSQIKLVTFPSKTSLAFSEKEVQK